ncbi:lytic transglycosylase domain-containing protein [Candidatus Haliotispira prima]|uniref:Lytic transglycosylase domain-containing protein n=1 Tax=Candidatus Haliotispira prima TaxID=3034016 RepID=A0ABY8MKJ7_9SPIO|nr:lytic transglycosylase domain-containing protein [Candidatus Haliotispira prima]
MLSLSSCNTAGTAQSLVWGMAPDQVQDRLAQRKLGEIKNHLGRNKTEETMQEALLLGQDSLYTIAMIFAEEKEWNLYHRAMVTQAHSGSDYGRKIAFDYMAEHRIFSAKDRLKSLQKHLKNEPEDEKQLTNAASLALARGKVDLARDYWSQSAASKRKPGEHLSFGQAILGLKLALSERDGPTANEYMRRVVLDFPVNSGHRTLHKNLGVRLAWRELLKKGRDGPELLQSLNWKRALLQKKFSETLPVLFASGEPDRNLRFWWSQHVLIEDTGRAMLAANNYRSQSRNVENGRKYLKNLLSRESPPDSLDKLAHNSLAYWYIRNNRNYDDMEKYRSQFRGDAELRPWLLTEYLYFFKNSAHWPALPAFLKSWYEEQPGEVSLNKNSIRLFRELYRNMSASKKVVPLQELYQSALEWGNKELILESAWNYRLAKGRPLSREEWQQMPGKLRNRTLSGIRLFILRADHADQGEKLLSDLPDHEPKGMLTPSEQMLHDLLSSLIDNGFANEALRLARLHHKDLARSSIVDFARRIQAEGRYDVSMRMVAQLTYDDNYRISREALELFYPKAFFELMKNFSTEHKLPLPIFYGLVRQESYFAPAVVSHAGAVGLSQLMPATMREVAGKIGYRDPDAKDPETNLKIGSYYLRYLVNHRWTKDFGQALMAYNAGLGNIRRWKARLGGRNSLEFNNAIPVRETRLYVQKISVAAIYYSVLYDWDDPISVLRSIYPDNFPSGEASPESSE